MTDELLPYYNQELAFLRHAGERFARDHPKVAARLRLGPEQAEDPHVERLIEAVAFMNARVQHRLDDDFPEVSDSLLGVLYPHYQRPIPSMSIVQMVADRDATACSVVERGAELETERVEGEPCRFRTCYDTEVWPIEVERATLTPTPFDAPQIRVARTSVACLHMRLRAAGGTPIGELGLERLRFHLPGQAERYALYEALLNDAAGIAVSTGPRDSDVTELPTSSITPVGFQADEGLLPYDARSFTGYRLLTELFAFPDKFLFVELGGLADVAARAGDALDVYVYLERLPKDLDQFVDASSFVLGCTPIVNLFERRAEPIRLDHTGYESRVVPDARRPAAMEVYSIDRLTAIDASGEARDLRPFYGIDHGPEADAAPVFWHALRRAATETADGAAGKGDRGTEVFLQVVDLEFQPSALEETVLTPFVTCTNRDLPRKLPFGAGRPRMALAAGGAIAEVRCLTAPTDPRRPPLGDGARWRLVSHLTLNHLSLSESEASVESLRELLRLYEVVGRPENLKLIEGVESLRCEPRMARIHAGGQPGYCRGIGATLRLDESHFSGSGTYLFASILERFLGLYATTNSFVQLSLKTDLRHGTVKRWSPRAGERALV
ncbi:MAG: type VI secretion system baseplate subunit TssF [Planctomycetota bacterium]